MKKYFPIVRSMLLRVATALGPFLSFAENKIYRNAESLKNRAPVFIVGSPRSGSTVLYQMLTHSLQSVYIDNLAYCFHNNLPFGIWLSRTIFGNKSHMNFSSKHGNTSNFHAPSECAGYWHRWFGKDNDYPTVNSVKSLQYDTLKEDFRKIMCKYDSGIIVKNLSNSQRIKILLKCFPNAKFIYIQRDPIYTVQSLYKARENAGIEDDAWWSVKPKNFAELSHLPLIEKLVAQVYYNELQIFEDLENAQNSQKMTVNYTQYIKTYASLLEFTEMPVVRNIDLVDFVFENRKVVENKIFLKIEAEVGKYCWKKLGYE